MGQYHAIINADKRFAMQPRSLGNFYKIGEFSGSWATPAALFLLLSEGWAGERVFVVGDYVTDGDLPETVLSDIPTSELFEATADPKRLRNVGWLGRKVLEDAAGVKFFKDGYSLYDFSEPDETFPVKCPDIQDITFVNHDIGQFVNAAHVGGESRLADYVDVHTFKFERPFPLVVVGLLACSNGPGGRGGGDIHVNNPLIGSWAGDRVSIMSLDQVPGDYTNISAEVRDIADAAAS